jgi:hypothetical protein
LPRTLAQIGMAEQALGRWADAEAHLTDAMKSTTNPWIVKNRELLEQSLANVAGHLGSIAVDGPKGATLEINGASVGVLPLDHPLRVPAGTVVLGVRASGFFPMQRVATVAAGQLGREQIDLVPLSQSGSPPPPPSTTELPAAGRTTSAGAATPAAEPGPAVTDAGQPAPASARAWQRPLAWVAVGLGGAALATGVTFHFIHENKLTSYNRKDASNANVCNRDSSGRFFGPPDCEDANNSAATAKTVLIVGYIGAAVFGGAAAALFLTAPSGGASPASAAAGHAPWRLHALGCGPGPGQWGFACGGLF